MLVTMRFFCVSLLIGTFLPRSHGQIGLGGFDAPWESDSANTKKDCPAGWVQFKTNCYLMVSYTSHRSWQRAQDFCQSSDANLATIESEEENKFVTEMFTNRTTRFSNNSTWIGLAKLCPQIKDKDAFRWIDGSFSTYRPSVFSWYGGSCIFMNATSPSPGMGGSWSAKPCNSSFPALCKKPLTKGPDVIINQNSLPSGSCSSADQCQLGSFCYKFYQKSKSFEEASQICRLAGSQLLSIHNDDESNFTLSMANVYTDVSTFWVGLNKLEPLAGWQWTDGTPVEYLNWQDGQPDADNYGLTESCVESATFKRSRISKKNPGEWDDTRCDFEKPFICKAQVSDVGRPTITPPPPTEPQICDKGWTLFDGRCYKVFGDQPEDRANYTDAQAMCRSHGGTQLRANLVSIRNVYEQMFIQSLLKEHPFDVWIGMASFWPTPNHFRWIDESSVRYTRWSETQRILPAQTPPSNIVTHSGSTTNDSDTFERTGGRPVFPWWPSSKFKSKDVVSCVRMTGVGSVGYWLQTHDEDCANLTLGFVCAELGTPGPKGGPTEPSTTQMIGKNPVQFVGDKSLSWKNAEDYCRTTYGENSHLLSITNPYEVGFSIATAHSMRRQGFSEFWIGLSDVQKKGTFAWSDNWPMYAELWGPGEPVQSVSNSQRCVKMVLNREDDFTTQIGGEWRVADCLEPYVFACKINKEKPPTLEFTGDCGKGWKNGESACYYINKDNKTFMSTAEVEFCHRKYNTSHLVSLHSEKEITHLISFLEINSSSDRFHIGLTKNGEGAWMWLDSSPVDFFNWANGEPQGKNDPDSLYCVEMDSRGKWYSASCRVFRPFICKRWKELVTTTKSDRTILPTVAAAQTAKVEAAGSSGSSEGGRTFGIIFGIILMIGLLCAVLYFAHRRQLINIPFLKRHTAAGGPMSFNNPIRMDDESSSYVH